MSLFDIPTLFEKGNCAVMNTIITCVCGCQSRKKWIQYGKRRDMHIECRIVGCWTNTRVWIGLYSQFKLFYFWREKNKYSFVFKCDTLCWIQLPVYGETNIFHALNFVRTEKYRWVHTQWAAQKLDIHTIVNFSLLYPSFSFMFILQVCEHWTQ